MCMPEQKKFLTLPPQHQNRQPGIESMMNPLPEYEDPNYRGSEKLKGKNRNLFFGYGVNCLNQGSQDYNDK